jgi:hypothetical protein
VEGVGVVEGRDAREFDPTTPADTRLYDFIIGGKDHFAADRNLAMDLLENDNTPPDTFPAVENRRFLRRAVRFLTDAGIRQFLEVGCGMPTRKNVHEIVHAAALDGRVVYVDYDPVAVCHYRVALGGVPGTAVIEADVRRPEDILNHPDTTSLIDFDEPLGVLLTSVLHCVPDEDDPVAITRCFRDAMPPGSHLVLSHLTADGKEPGIVARGRELVARMRDPVRARSREYIRSLFDGLELLEPGLVSGTDWRPDRFYPPPSGWLAAGVARKVT